MQRPTKCFQRLDLCGGWGGEKLGVKDAGPALGRRKGLGVLAISILPRNEQHVNEMQISLYCPQLGRLC